MPQRTTCHQLAPPRLCTAHSRHGALDQLFGSRLLTFVSCLLDAPRFLFVCSMRLDILLFDCCVHYGSSVFARPSYGTLCLHQTHHTLSTTQLGSRLISKWSCAATWAGMSAVYNFASRESIGSPALANLEHNSSHLDILRLTVIVPVKLCCAALSQALHVALRASCTLSGSSTEPAGTPRKVCSPKRLALPDLDFSSAGSAGIVTVVVP